MSVLRLAGARPTNLLRIKLAHYQQLGKAVGDVAVNISNAESDADVQLLASVTQQTFAKGLDADKPEIVIEGKQGSCSVTITTAQWRLWSQA